MWISKKELNEKLTHAYLVGYQVGYTDGGREGKYTTATLEEMTYCGDDVKLTNEIFKKLIRGEIKKYDRNERS